MFDVNREKIFHEQSHRLYRLTRLRVADRIDEQSPMFPQLVREQYAGACERLQLVAPDA